MLTEDSLRPSVPTRAAPGNRRTITPRRRRGKTKFLLAGLLVVAAIGYMLYSAMQSGSEYYVTATELKAMGDKAIDQPTKVGGRVVDGSIQWDKGNNSVTFSVTDGTQSLPVHYTGVVPDTFQPNTDVILEGKLGADGQFQATTLLAKCASKYTPAN